MVICIEAGLGLDQAVLRVADELRISQPELTEEFTLLNLEQRAGRPRSEAWKNLAERTDLDSVRGLVAMLTQPSRTEPVSRTPCAFTRTYCAPSGVSQRKNKRRRPR